MTYIHFVNLTFLLCNDSSKIFLSLLARREELWTWISCDWIRISCLGYRSSCIPVRSNHDSLYIYRGEENFAIALLWGCMLIVTALQYTW